MDREGLDLNAVGDAAERLGILAAAGRYFRGAALGGKTVGRELTGPMAKNPIMVVLIGLPGSGKSTLAKVWDERQVLSLDNFRKIVSGDENDQDATAEAVRALHATLDDRLSRGLTTVVDATNATPGVREPLLARASAHNAPAVALVVDTPLPIAQARNATRPGPVEGARYGRRVPAEFLDMQDRQIQESVPHLRDEGFAQVIIHTYQEAPT
jgi:predicted kinase